MDARKEYARIRAENPTLDAAICWRWARETVRNAELFDVLGVPRFADYGAEYRHALPDGSTIVYRVNPDDFSEFEERLSVRVECMRYGPENRNRDFPDWHITRDGAAIVYPSRAYGDWARIETDYSLAERVADRSKAGMSRHVAWIAARDSLRREFDSIREYWEQRETWLACRVELRNAAGAVVAESSLCGVDTARDYWRDALLEMARDVLAEYARECDATIKHDRARLAAIRSTARKLIRELRALRAIAVDAPQACAVLRGHVQALRENARQCARVIRDARRGAAMVAGIAP